MKVAVVGGGISGLVAAYRLAGSGHDVTCFEAEGRPGGWIRSERHDGFLCERGPQGLLDGAPEVRTLLDDVGLRPRALPASPAARRRLIFLGGRLREVPTSPRSLLTTDLLSWRGKARLLREPWVEPSSSSEEETVLGFGTRRLGPEAARALVAPATIGVFAGDAARLSLKSAFPRIAALEAEHGNLLRGVRVLRRQGRSVGRLLSFPDGLEELPRALAAHLGARLKRGLVRGLAREGSAWRIILEGQEDDSADTVVLASGPRATADLLSTLAPEASRALRSIPLVPVVVVCLGFRRSELGMDLDAYGVLVARGEAPGLLGCQYESTVFPGRAPTGSVLLRALLGGSFEPSLVEASEEALVARAVSDLRQVTGLAAAPDFQAVFKLREAIPQYELGHAAKVRAVEEVTKRHPGLHIIGYALRGVGLADCIQDATALAARLDAL